MNCPSMPFFVVYFEVKQFLASEAFIKVDSHLVIFKSLVVLFSGHKIRMNFQTQLLNADKKLTIFRRLLYILFLF